jgi:hypothetical protein
VLVIKVDQHGFPVVTAAPDVVDYLSVLVKVVHFAEVSLNQVELHLDLLDLAGLGLQVVDRRQDLPDLAEDVLHLLRSHLRLVELDSVEASG